MDEFYCFALNATDWLTGFVSHTATVIGSDISRTANGAENVSQFSTESYINTGINLTLLSQYSLTSAMAGVYAHTADDWGTGNFDPFGVEDNDASRLRFRHRGSDSNDTRTSVNSNTMVTNSLLNTDLAGNLWSIGTMGGTAALYKNAVQQASTGAGGDLTVPSTNVGIFGTIDESNPSVTQQSSRPAIFTSFYVGSGAIDLTALVGRINTLHTALGVT
jgi:hypothetical protein